MFIIGVAIGGLIVIILIVLLTVCKVKKRYCFEDKKVDVMRNHDKVIIKDFDRISSPKKDADKNKMSIMALSSSVSVA